MVLLWDSYSLALEPLVALACLGALVLLLRWGFGGPSRSLVERRPRPGTPQEYGLLVPVLAPDTPAVADRARRLLAEAGLDVTVASTTSGLRVMVFPRDVEAARRVLGGETDQVSQ
jgi:hypothetical protein